MLVNNSMVIFVDNKSDWLLFFDILSDRVCSVLILVGIAFENDLLSVGNIKSKILICSIIQFKHIFIISDVVSSIFISLFPELFLLLGILSLWFGKFFFNLFVFLTIFSFLFLLLLFILLQQLAVILSCITFQIILEFFQLLLCHLWQHFEDVLVS